MKKKVHTPPSTMAKPMEHSPHQYGCGECRVREEMISLLRSQLLQQTEMNKQMQEKMLAMSGDAADRWHRLKMTEMAHLRPAPTEGIVPQDDLTFEEDRAVDELLSKLTGNFQ